MKHRFILISILFLIVLSSATSPVATLAQHKSATLSPIQHVIWISKENHTFDSLFGTFPGANGATTGKIKVNGVVTTIPLNPGQNVMVNFCNVWGCAQKADDNGKMDAFNLADKPLCGAPPYACYQTGGPTLVPNYWTLAQNYVLSDNAWSSLRGPSFPNHLMMMAGGSGPDITHSAINNPLGGSTWGCDATSAETVQLYDGEKVPPCFSYSTLVDEMQAAGVSWKYYASQQGQGGYIWNSADAFSQIRNTSLWQTNDVPWQHFATDAANGNLPAFSWLMPNWATSEHDTTNECTGENWTIQQINAVMNGPDWSSTVIVVTWDDWGGLYDHVAPPNPDGLGYGFRVPMLVISPFAYAGDNPANTHVSHDQVEFSSVLKLAETAFGLPSLGRRDATAGDLMQLLDTSTVHNAPTPLAPRVCPSVTLPPAPQEIDD